MKNVIEYIILFLVIVIFVIALSGCGDDASQTTIDCNPQPVTVTVSSSDDITIDGEAIESISELTTEEGNTEVTVIGCDITITGTTITDNSTDNSVGDTVTTSSS